MNFSTLQDDILVVEFSVSELFTGEVEDDVSYLVEAVVVAVS